MFYFTPPPYIFVKRTFIFCKLPQIINRCFEYAAQTKPPAGSVLGSEAGGGRHDLAGSKPEQGQQEDEEAAPAHDPNQKTARPRSDMLRGLLSFFMEKNHAFPGFCGSSAFAVTTMTRTVTGLPFLSVPL